jgi:hypothetical protein
MGVLIPAQRSALEARATQYKSDRKQLNTVIDALLDLTPLPKDLVKVLSAIGADQQGLVFLVKKALEEDDKL